MKVHLILLAWGVCTCDSLRAQTAIELDPCLKYAMMPYCPFLDLNDYLPYIVCASDGNTYVNECYMCRVNRNLRIEHMGSCKADSGEVEEYEEEYYDDGSPYLNDYYKK